MATRNEQLEILFKSNPELEAAKYSLTSLIESNEVQALCFIFDCAIMIAYNQGHIDHIKEQELANVKRKISNKV